MLPVPQSTLMSREWERGPNAARILGHALRLGSMEHERRELFQMALALETGELPLIEQGGYAVFPAVENDHRLITPRQDGTNAITDPYSAPPSSRSAAVGTRASAGRPTATPAAAEAGPAARGGITRGGLYSLGDVISEDTSPLAIYFPQFSPPLFDRQVGLWYREGWLRPLLGLANSFDVRLYYDVEPLAQPLVVVPAIGAATPHQWKHTRRGVDFRSLCYTFAPDGTFQRGRSRDDNAAEVLRQAVMWLLRYIIWREFGFWPGEEVGHDPAEIERRTRPSDPCPAHAWRSYGDCCRRHILQVLQRRDDLRFGVNPAARIADTG
jgi:hypothetical protein